MVRTSTGKSQPDTSYPMLEEDGYGVLHEPDRSKGDKAGSKRQFLVWRCNFEQGTGFAKLSVQGLELARLCSEIKASSDESYNISGYALGILLCD